MIGIAVASGMIRSQVIVHLLSNHSPSLDRLPFNYSDHQFLLNVKAVQPICFPGLSKGLKCPM